MFSERDYYHRSRYGYRDNSIIKPLIIANVGVFVLQLLLPGLTGFLSLSFGEIKALQLWRLGTYMFAHAPDNMFHILLNMWGLYIFGGPLEQQIGPHRFLKLYFICGLVGGGIWLIFNTSQVTIPPGIERYPSVIGASGAVFGTMMAAAMLAPNRQYMLLFPPIPVRLKTLVTVYAALEIYNTLVRGGGRVAHLAHLGGLLGGYLFVVYAIPGWRNFNPLQFFLGKINQWRLRRHWRQFNASGGRRDFSDDEDDELTIDDILDKIGREGLSSLTPRERKKLENARNHLKGKH